MPPLQQSRARAHSQSIHAADARPTRPLSPPKNGPCSSQDAPGRPLEHKTSEQLELERLERERQQAAQLRRQNAAALQSVLQQPAPPPAHSSKPLTQPVGLELRTSKRQRVHGMETRSMGPDAEDTVWRSLAEQVATYDFRAPSLQGGKSSAAAAPGATTRPQHGQNMELTLPKSPSFATAKRSRAPRFKPREVVEEEMMAAMPKFRARPVP